jgi:hypothetical protein
LAQDRCAGHVEQAGFQSETDANVWLAENLKALSAAAAKAEAAKAA